MNKGLKQMMLLWLFAIACLLFTIIIGCGNENDKYIKIDAKKNNTYILPKGMKLVNVTDKSYNELGVLMRPMKKGEKAETYVWCYMNGVRLVTIKETEE